MFSRPPRLKLGILGSEVAESATTPGPFSICYGLGAVSRHTIEENAEILVELAIPRVGSGSWDDFRSRMIYGKNVWIGDNKAKFLARDENDKYSLYDREFWFLEKPEPGEQTIKVAGLVDVNQNPVSADDIQSRTITFARGFLLWSPLPENDFELDTAWLSKSFQERGLYAAGVTSPVVRRSAMIPHNTSMVLKHSVWAKIQSEIVILRSTMVGYKRRILSRVIEAWKIWRLLRIVEAYEAWREGGDEN